jgi:hypothetical protein
MICGDEEGEKIKGKGKNAFKKGTAAKIKSLEENE